MPAKAAAPPPPVEIDYSWLLPPTDLRHTDEQLAALTPSERFRMDCSHNFTFFAHTITTLLADVQANRSRVLCVDGVAMFTAAAAAAASVALSSSSSLAAASGSGVSSLSSSTVAVAASAAAASESKAQHIAAKRHFGDGQAELLSAHLRHNSSFLAVALRNLTSLSVSGIGMLLFELSRHPTVRVVDLRGTFLSSECFHALRDLPRLNPNIVRVDLEGCTVPDDVAAAVGAGCRINLLSRREVNLEPQQHQHRKDDDDKEKNTADDAATRSTSTSWSPSPLSTTDVIRIVVQDCDAQDEALRKVAAAHRDDVLPPTRERIDVARAIARFKAL